MAAHRRRGFGDSALRRNERLDTGVVRRLWLGGGLGSSSLGSAGFCSRFGGCLCLLFVLLGVLARLLGGCATGRNGERRYGDQSDPAQAIVMNGHRLPRPLAAHNVGPRQCYCDYVAR